MLNRREKLEEYILGNLDKLYRLAFSYSRNKEDAEDIVNESVVKALEAIDNLREVQFLGTWLYRIVINTANTHMKKKSKIIFFDELINEEDGKEDQYQDVDLYHKVMNLDLKYKMPVILKYYEDMTIEQIATVLEENENTIKTRLYKALDILKKNMEKEMKFDEQRF